MIRRFQAWRHARHCIGCKKDRQRRKAAKRRASGRR